MRIECADKLSSEQLAIWQNFLSAAHHTHVEQDPRFAEVLRGDGQDVVFAMGWRGQTLAAAGMFGLRRHPVLSGHHSYALAYSGPVCDDPDAMIQFIEGIARHKAFSRVGALRVTPYWINEDGRLIGNRLAGAGYVPFETQEMRQTGLTDITGSPADIAARFSQTGRRKLRKAERLDLTVESVMDEDLALEFLNRLNKHRGERGLGPIPEGWFLAAFHNIFRTDDLGVLQVTRHQGRILAGTLLHRSRDAVHYMNSFFDAELAAELGDLRIAPFQLFQAMLWANARGCKHFDWEGYIRDLPPTHRLYGIYRYKNDFSPVETPRVLGHQKIMRPMIYASGNARALLAPYVEPLIQRARGGARPATEQAAS